MDLAYIQRELDALYARFHHREMVSPDPLEFLYEYPELRDREIVGLVASSLAYGRVPHILVSVARVLLSLGPKPAAFIENTDREALRRLYGGFRHRFCPGEEVADLLWAGHRVASEYDSLGDCFSLGVSEDDDDVIPALTRFVSELRRAGAPSSHLLPSPEGGSACKRLNLYLRWMVRHDEVDPGGWDPTPKPKLIVPLDTHVFRLARRLEMTERRQPNLEAAREITVVLRRLSPEDPVRYDFSLARAGMVEEDRSGDATD